jgi:hypothetical protein
MKKLLGIVVLGLLWCSATYAKPLNWGTLIEGTKKIESLLPKCVGEDIGQWKYCWGTHINPDGETYVGKFINGTKQGLGTLMYPDGRKLFGEFYNGTLNGQVTILFPDGKVENCTYSNSRYCCCPPNVWCYC